MLLGWTYRPRLVHLVLVWRSWLWLVIPVSTIWRIAWISIRVTLLLNLSIYSRGSSILRIAWSVSMRKWWPTCIPCFHIFLQILIICYESFILFSCCQKGDILGSRRIYRIDTCLHIILLHFDIHFFLDHIAYLDILAFWIYDVLIDTFHIWYAYLFDDLHFTKILLYTWTLEEWWNWCVTNMLKW